MLHAAWDRSQAQLVSLLQYFPWGYPLVAAALHAVLHAAQVPLFAGVPTLDYLVPILPCRVPTHRCPVPTLHYLAPMLRSPNCVGAAVYTLRWPLPCRCSCMGAGLQVPSMHMPLFQKHKARQQRLRHAISFVRQCGQRVVVLNRDHTTHPRVQARFSWGRSTLQQS